MTRTGWIRTTAAAAACLLAASTLPLSAQPPASPGAEPIRGARGTVLLPSMMGGPGSFGPFGARRLCDPRSVGLTPWRVTWIERVLKPTEAQQKPLADLKAASAQAIEMFATACPPRTPRGQAAPAQLDMMEKRLGQALAAVRTVRPAFEAFYAALDASQRTIIDELGPKRSGWEW